MCKFEVWACTKCFKVERPKTIKSKRALPKRRYYILIEEVRCDYWYCNATDSAFAPAVSIDTAQATCGDQMCAVDRCKCVINTWDCCRARRHRRGRSECYPYFYSIDVSARRDDEVRSDVDRLRIEPYYLPTLDAKTVLACLMDILPDDDYVIWYTRYDETNVGHYMGNYSFFMSTYYKDDVADSRLFYSVKVVRRYGDACPQMYEGVLGKFLRLRSLLRKERRAGSQRLGEQLSFESYSVVIARRQSKKETLQKNAATD